MHPTTCDLCGRSVPAHAHYVVKMEVYADPTLPPLDTEGMEGQDVAQTLQDLMAELERYTADDLQDQVHRRFEFRLCAACQSQFLANPLGKPRAELPGRN